MVTPPPTPPPLDPDAFGHRLARRLEMRVAPPAPTCHQRPDELPEEGGHKLPGRKSLVALSGGGHLMLLRGARVGDGTYGKVLWGLVARPPEGGGRADCEVVAVKKPRLSLLRTYLNDGAPPPEAVSPEVVRSHALAAVRHECRMARRAGSPAAPHRLVVTDKQAYMLLPPMACSLNHSRVAPLVRRLGGAAWGAFMLEQLLPQLQRAHRGDVVHHDLSHGNILVRGGHLHLTDFGIAHGAAAPNPSLPHGTAWCSPPWALCQCRPSPQQSLADDYFSLSMLTLSVAAGPSGQKMTQQMRRLVDDAPGEAHRRAYLAAFPAWHRNEPAVFETPRCSSAFRHLSGALRAVAPPLRRHLRALMAPDAAARIAAAQRLGRTPQMSAGQRRVIAIHLHRLETARAERASAEVWCALQRGDAVAAKPRLD